MKFLATEEIFPSKIVAGIAGLKQTGKSLYAFEQAFTVNGDTLYISTEEANSFFFDAWKPIFEEKYKKELNFNFQYVANAIDLLEFFGVKGEITTSESKDKAIKVDFQPKELDTENSPFQKFMAQNPNVRYLVIDSLTTAFDALIIGGRQNFPLRAQLEELFFNILNSNVARLKHDLYIYTTNHITFNPTDPRVSTYHMLEELFQVKGGKMIGHYIKVLFGLEKKDRPHGYRILHVIRYPTIAEFDKKYDLLIKTDGFYNTTKEGIKELKEEIKQKKEQEKQNLKAQETEQKANESE